jgi:phosphopantothenoylcysteine decarboxylase
MGKVNVLLCCSGSVATLKVPEIVVKLSESKLFNIRIVGSKSSLHFLDNAKLYNLAMWKQFESIGGMELVFTDKEEWSLWTKIGDPVLHIELSNWADVVIVAPCSADLIAKINAGISDNLLLRYLLSLVIVLLASIRIIIIYTYVFMRLKIFICTRI